ARLAAPAASHAFPTRRSSDLAAPRAGGGAGRARPRRAGTTGAVQRLTGGGSGSRSDDDDIGCATGRRTRLTSLAVNVMLPTESDCSHRVTKPEATTPTASERCITWQ